VRYVKIVPIYKVHHSKLRIIDSMARVSLGRLHYQSLFEARDLLLADAVAYRYTWHLEHLDARCPSSRCMHEGVSVACGCIIAVWASEGRVTVAPLETGLVEFTLVEWLETSIN